MMSTEPLLEVEMVDYLKNESTIPEDWGNFAMDGLTVNDGHDNN
jgi:hypothetical protein